MCKTKHTTKCLSGNNFFGILQNHEHKQVCLSVLFSGRTTQNIFFALVYNTNQQQHMLNIWQQQQQQQQQQHRIYKLWNDTDITK